MYFPHLWSSVSSVAQWMNNFLQVQLQLQHHMMFIDCWIPIFNFERTNTFSVLTTATTLFVSHLRPPSSQWAWAQLNTEHMHHQLRKWHCPLPAVAVIDDDDGQYVCILFNECFVFFFFLSFTARWRRRVTNDTIPLQPAVVRQHGQWQQHPTPLLANVIRGGILFFSHFS